VETARNHADESHAGQHYAIWMEEKGLADWRDYFLDWPPRPGEGGKTKYWERENRHWALPEQYHYTTWTGERTVANIEQCVADGKPFFLWSSFQDPHPPYLVPEPWASMYNPEDMAPGVCTEGEFDRMPPHFAKTQQKEPDFSMYRETYGPHGFHSHMTEDGELRRDIAAYYGMISFMDREIGRILDCLDRLGIADNTLVMFSTDHGHFLGQHGLVAKGAFHYEDMIKLPMLIRYPGRVPAGRVNSALQSQVDYAPTFLSTAGIPAPGLMQGVDQLPNWTAQAGPARDHVIVENRHEPTLVHLRTYVDERYKLTVYRDHDYGELFDLQQDPGEIDNLWDDPEAAALKARLLHHFMKAELRREPTRMDRIAGA